MHLLKPLLPLTTILALANAGPAAYGVCQAGCSGVVVACYSGAGFTFGTVTAGAGIPAAIVACNSAYGTCQAACAAVLLAPTLESWYVDITISQLPTVTNVLNRFRENG